jgi:hypothetical protein
MRTLLLRLAMPENPENQQQPDKPAPKKVQGTVRIRATAKSTSRASVRIRLIRHSPVTDPKKVAAARASVQRLKTKKLKEGRTSDESNAEDLDDLDLPLITPG